MIGGRKDLIELAIYGPDISTMTDEEKADLQKFYDGVASMTQRKAFVLLSGGIDSSTCLALAHNQFEKVEGISIYYGQRHAREIRYAEKQCEILNIPHRILACDALGGGMLTDAEQVIPDIRYDQIEGVSPTYVPFRNGTMLSMITAEAQRWVNEQPSGAQDADQQREAAVFFGAHAEDAHNWAYPDCTPEFIGAMANAIYIGTYHRVRLHTPLMWLQKWQIVRLGYPLRVQYEHTWSCYAGGEKHCGQCPTCYARQDAFMKANIPDPTDYATPRKAA